MRGLAALVPAMLLLGAPGATANACTGTGCAPVLSVEPATVTAGSQDPVFVVGAPAGAVRSVQLAPGGGSLQFDRLRTGAIAVYLPGGAAAGRYVLSVGGTPGWRVDLALTVAAPPAAGVQAAAVQGGATAPDASASATPAPASIPRAQTAAEAQHDDRTIIYTGMVVGGMVVLGLLVLLLRLAHWRWVMHRWGVRGNRL